MAQRCLLASRPASASAPAPRLLNQGRCRLGPSSRRALRLAWAAVVGRHAGPNGLPAPIVGAGAPPLHPSAEIRGRLRRQHLKAREEADRRAHGALPLLQRAPGRHPGGGCRTSLSPHHQMSSLHGVSRAVEVFEGMHEKRVVTLTILNTSQSARSPVAMTYVFLLIQFRGFPPHLFMLSNDPNMQLEAPMQFTELLSICENSITDPVLSYSVCLFTLKSFYLHMPTTILLHLYLVGQELLPILPHQKVFINDLVTNTTRASRFTVSVVFIRAYDIGLFPLMHSSL